MVSVAPWAEWKRPVGFWMSGEGVGMLELVCGGLGWKFAGEVIFGHKMGEVFVVVGSGCGELLEWSFGCRRGGVSVSSWKEFGLVLGSVELVISEGR